MSTIVGERECVRQRIYRAGIIVEFDVYSSVSSGHSCVRFQEAAGYAPACPVSTSQKEWDEYARRYLDQ